MKLINQLLHDTRGTSSVEYGLICGLVVVGLLVVLQGLGTSVSGSYDDTKTKIALATRT